MIQGRDTRGGLVLWESIGIRMNYVLGAIYFLVVLKLFTEGDSNFISHASPEATRDVYNEISLPIYESWVKTSQEFREPHCFNVFG